MNIKPRAIYPKILSALVRGKSILLLGPRQVGKTTLMKQIDCDWYLNLADVEMKLRYQRDITLLKREILKLAKDNNGMPLVIIDEVQKIPELMDMVQFLIDDHVAQFILTGSSARKLKHANVNLLPGRVVSMKMSPLSLIEYEDKQPLLEELLVYGSLPGIQAQALCPDKETDLQSYVYTYLEEEIKAEAQIRNLGAFSRFFELAAAESGNIINFTKLSQEVGVSYHTIQSYYQILEDCMVAERIEPLTKTKYRKRLTKSNKYLMFDLGVRRLAAHEGDKQPLEVKGRLFEQMIGLELLRIAAQLNQHAKLYFWRDLNGPEVDWVIAINGQYIPIEVKLTDNPRSNDIKHLETFLDEYDNATKAYVICCTPRALTCSDRVDALPWFDLPKVFEA